MYEHSFIKYEHTQQKRAHIHRNSVTTRKDTNRAPD